MSDKGKHISQSKKLIFFIIIPVTPSVSWIWFPVTVETALTVAAEVLAFPSESPSSTVGISSLTIIIPPFTAIVTAVVFVPAIISTLAVK